MIPPHIIPNKQKAIFLAKRQLAEFIYDAVNLENIPYTLPEIQTLLQGITVGGHKISDQMIVLNQATAWKHLFDLLENDQFLLSKEVACHLHELAAKNEVLTWGKFRTGSVTISGTNYIPPPPQKLDVLWDNMLLKANEITDIYERAIYIFLYMSRMQFFYDVNKRLGRFMMNGILLAAGYPAINLPAKKQLTFNQLMLKFYADGDMSAMKKFMMQCLSPTIITIMQERGLND